MAEFSPFTDLLEFHRAITPEHFAELPSVPEDRIIDVRWRLIEEEVRELFDAMHADDLTEIADGIADAIYVLIGTAIAYGVDLPAVWAEVHRTNMAKADGPVVNGKRMKPEGWTPPDIAAVLARQRPLSEEYPAPEVVHG